MNQLNDFWSTVNNSTILQDKNQSYDIIMTRVQNLFKRSTENRVLLLLFFEI